MKLRAIIKKADDWWIGWLVDIPGGQCPGKNQRRIAGIPN